MTIASKRIRRSGAAAAAPKAKTRKSAASAKVGQTSLPVYHQLYAILRQQIMDGVYKENEALPTEMRLTELYKLSRVTVRKALARLEQDGLLVRQQGVGTFVAPKGRHASSKRLSGLVDNLITIGVETTAKLLSFTDSFLAPPSLSAAEKLKLAPDERCTRIERLRWHAGKPFSLTVIYIRNVDKLRLTREQVEADDRPLIYHLEERGVIASSAEQTLSAVVSDADIAKRLAVPVGLPLIRAQRTVYTKKGDPILYQESLYNPDLYEYHITLSRDSKSARTQWRHV